VKKELVQSDSSDSEPDVVVQRLKGPTDCHNPEFMKSLQLRKNSFKDLKLKNIELISTIQTNGSLKKRVELPVDYSLFMYGN
jgi:hypothetical protein